MSRALLLCLVLLLSACAGLGEREFSLGDAAGPRERRLLWPPPSDREVPRYLYLGDLVGEGNLVRRQPDGSGLRDALAWLVGLADGLDRSRRLERPQAGTLDDRGRILVTDLGRAAVFVFDEARASLDVWEQADGVRGFVAPVGIAAGPGGQTLVADADLALVARLDPDGNPLPAIGKGELQRPTGLAYDPASRRLFVADTAAHQIKVFDLEGNLLARWGSRGDAPGQFNFPTHLALAGERLHVSDTLNARVQILSSVDGSPVGGVGRRGLYIGQLVRPKGVALDGEGNVYAVESYFDHLLVYNRRGEFLMAIGGVGDAPGRFHLPAGVWVDARNRIFVADTLNRRVSVFQFLGGGAEND